MSGMNYVYVTRWGVGVEKGFALLGLPSPKELEYCQQIPRWNDDFYLSSGK